MSPPRLRVYYDARCALCRSFSLFLSRSETRGRVQVLPLTALGARSSVDPLRAAQELASVDQCGAVRYGFESVCAIFRLLPRYRWMAPLLSFLQVTGLGQAFYFLVARSRRGCAVPWISGKRYQKKTDYVAKN